MQIITWLRVAIGVVGSLAVVAIGNLYLLPYLDRMNVIVLTYKDGNFWDGVFWLSIFSVPLWVVIAYILALVEWRFWRKFRGQHRYAKSCIPQYVLEYWTSVVVLTGVLYALYMVSNWEVRPFIEALFPVLGHGFLFGWGLLVSGITTIILWIISHRNEWRKWVSVGVALSIVVSIVLGVYSESSRLWWYLSLSDEERTERYGQRYVRPEERPIERVVVFDPAMSAQRWERYLEALEWTVFDEGLEEVEISIIDGDGQTIALIMVEGDLEEVREQYRQKMEASGRQDTWYEDVRIDSMRIRGGRYRSVFQRIERVEGFEEADIQ